MFTFSVVLAKARIHALKKIEERTGSMDRPPSRTTTDKNRGKSQEGNTKTK